MNTYHGAMRIKKYLMENFEVYDGIDEIALPEVWSETTFKRDIWGNREQFGDIGDGAVIWFAHFCEEATKRFPFSDYYDEMLALLPDNLYIYSMDEGRISICEIK